MKIKNYGEILYSGRHLICVICGKEARYYIEYDALEKYYCRKHFGEALGIKTAKNKRKK